MLLNIVVILPAINRLNPNRKSFLKDIKEKLLQGKSEKSTGKLNSVHQEKADKLTEERNQLRGSLSPTAALKTDFNGSSLQTG